MPEHDPRLYRRALGFGSQGAAKSFLDAKDITPTIDEAYIALLNERLEAVAEKINSTLPANIRIQDIEAFKNEYIDGSYETIRRANILPRLNNQGRRPEKVYFSWMRGLLISQLFRPALLTIFGAQDNQFSFIGADDLRDPDSFKRAPAADARVAYGGGNVRLEIQAGLQGINEVKRHKFIEANRVFAESGEHSVAVHIDLFNGKVAFIRLDGVPEGTAEWAVSKRMESQEVYQIQESDFCWNITDNPPRFTDLGLL